MSDSLGAYLCSVRSCCGVCRWWTRAAAPEPTRSRPARHRSTRWSWWTRTPPDFWCSAPAEVSLEQRKHPTQHNTHHLALVSSRESLTWRRQSQGFVGDALLDQRIPAMTSSTCSLLHHCWYNWWDDREKQSTVSLLHSWCRREWITDWISRETEWNSTLFLPSCCYLHYFLR